MTMADADRERRQRWAATTPEERLAWLAETQRFALLVGALPRRRFFTAVVVALALR